MQVDEQQLTASVATVTAPRTLAKPRQPLADLSNAVLSNPGGPGSAKFRYTTSLPIASSPAAGMMLSSPQPPSSVGFNESSSPVRSSSVFRFSSPALDDGEWSRHPSSAPTSPPPPHPVVPPAHGPMKESFSRVLEVAAERQHSIALASSSESLVLTSSPPPSPAPTATGTAKPTTTSSLQGDQVEQIRIQSIDGGKAQTFTLSLGHTIYVGRKLKPAAMPSGNPNDHRFLKLPKAAKHASRHHCTITLHGIKEGRSSSSSSNNNNKDHRSGLVGKLRIDAVGQNGVQLEGVRTAQGKHDIDVTDGQEVRVGFYSGFEINVKVEIKSARSKAAERVKKRPLSGVKKVASRMTPVEQMSDTAIEAVKGTSTLKDEATATKETVAHKPSLPSTDDARVLTPAPMPVTTGLASATTSSLAAMRGPSATAQAVGKHKRIKRSSSVVSSLSNTARSRSGSAAPSPYAHQDDDGYPPEDDTSGEEEEDENELAARLEAEAACQRVQEFVKGNEVDLVGCLASAMVFQSRAALTTSEAISVLLENQPSFLHEGDVEAWRLSVLKVLRCPESPFEKIENSNLIKDASGKKLEPSWFYNPTLDKDAVRRSSLEPFVKSLRATQRQKKQYYYKPISDLKRKRW